MCLQIFQIPVSEAKLYSTDISETKRKYYKLMCNGETVFCFSVYKNYYHKRNTYIQPYFIKKHFDAKSVFLFLKNYFASPLQCMLKNDDIWIPILKSGGFNLVRRCYEREFTKDDLKSNEIDNVNIEVCTLENEEYVAACKLLYESYAKNHEGINPLSVSFDEFATDLPKTVYCIEGGLDNGFVFTEENEICYVGGNSNVEVLFVAVLNIIFSKYQYVMFETDDVDSVAMKLKNLFCDVRDDSFDTYIFS